MIINSKFSSLWLEKKEEWVAPHDQDVCYIQRYAINEEMRIQLTGFVSDFAAKYTNQEGVDTPLNVKLLYTITNLIAGLLAYSFLPKKSSIKVDVIDEKQLMLF